MKRQMRVNTKNLALSRVVKADQPTVDAVEENSVMEPALVMPRQVEPFLESLKKSELHAELHKALHMELEDAKNVQRALFPPQSLAIPGLSVEAFYQPARCIGGDYYDLLSLPGGRWGIAIGDVSGKGVRRGLAHGRPPCFTPGPGVASLFKPLDTD